MAPTKDAKTMAAEILAQREGSTKPSAEEAQYLNGDVFDEDTGQPLGHLSEEVSELLTLPAQLGIYFDGYWYVFKPQSRYKHEEIPDAPAEQDNPSKSLTDQ